MNLWLITFASLAAIPADQARNKRLLIRASNSSDAWEQARMRLGDVSCVVSIKPLAEDPS